jgi:hypothetical protein
VGCIYCLFASDDGIPRYVGKTTREPERRWKEHVARALDKSDEGRLCDWLRDVLRRGALVQFWVLQEDIAPVDLDTFEVYWMRQFANLFNDGRNGADEPTEIGRAITTSIQQALKR